MADRCGGTNRCEEIVRIFAISLDLLAGTINCKLFVVQGMTSDSIFSNLAVLD